MAWLSLLLILAALIIGYQSIFGSGTFRRRRATDLLEEALAAEKAVREEEEPKKKQGFFPREEMLRVSGIAIPGHTLRIVEIGIGAGVAALGLVVGLTVPMAVLLLIAIPMAAEAWLTSRAMRTWYQAHMDFGVFINLVSTFSQGAAAREAVILAAREMSQQQKESPIAGYLAAVAQELSTGASFEKAFEPILPYFGRIMRNFVRTLSDWEKRGSQTSLRELLAPISKALMDINDTVERMEADLTTARIEATLVPIFPVIFALLLSATMPAARQFYNTLVGGIIQAVVYAFALWAYIKSQQALMRPREVLKM